MTCCSRKKNYVVIKLYSILPNKFIVHTIKTVFTLVNIDVSIYMMTYEVGWLYSCFKNNTSYFLFFKIVYKIRGTCLFSCSFPLPLTVLSVPLFFIVSKVLSKRGSVRYWAHGTAVSCEICTHCPQYVTSKSWVSSRQINMSGTTCK